MKLMWFRLIGNLDGKRVCYVRNGWWSDRRINDGVMRRRQLGLQKSWVDRNESHHRKGYSFS